MTIDNWTCGKCARIGQRRKGTDRYCVMCRRAYNAKRSTSDAKKARADSYYWNVHVPLMQKRLTEKYPMRGGKVGVFYQRHETNPLDGTVSGLIHSRETWEGYNLRLDREQE